MLAMASPDHNASYLVHFGCASVGTRVASLGRPPRRLPALDGVPDTKTGDTEFRCRGEVTPEHAESLRGAPSAMGERVTEAALAGFEVRIAVTLADFGALDLKERVL